MSVDTGGHIAQYTRKELDRVFLQPYSVFSLLDLHAFHSAVTVACFAVQGGDQLVRGGTRHTMPLDNER